MKPVAIFRFSRSEGPGYLADYLNRHQLPWELVPIDEGAPVPTDITAYSGMAMMGGPMSVNDPLPWVRPLLGLIRQAHAHDVPMIGHCLGGQLIAKALGGTVTDNKCHEVGWHAIESVADELAGQWLGGARAFTTFQWHYQTFSIPAGATRLLRNDYCENQAYVLGKHIGFQCHIEMTVPLVELWCKQSADEIARLAPQPSAQSVAEILFDLDVRVAELNGVAEKVYDRWTAGLQG